MNDASHAGQDVDQQALDWVVQARNGLTAAQRQALQQWLQHPDHRQAYARWEQDWHALDAAPADAVERLRQGLPPAGGRMPMPRRRLLLGGMGLAACTVFGAGLAIQYRQGALSSHDYVTAPGQTRDVALADGSRIELDTATRLTVAQYADHYALDLQQGQAWFDLRPADASPASADARHAVYRILAGALRLTASGAMSVRHTPAPTGQGSVHVAVAAGRVHMERVAVWTDWLPGRRLPSQQAIDLQAGQQGWAGGESDWRIQPVALQDVAAWRQGRLVVQDMTLDQVLAEFARYGHAVPRITDPRVARLRVAGSFDLRQPAAFYRLLPQILPVRIAPQGRELTIVMLQGA